MWERGAQPPDRCQRGAPSHSTLRPSSLSVCEVLSSSITALGLHHRLCRDGRPKATDPVKRGQQTGAQSSCCRWEPRGAPLPWLQEGTWACGRGGEGGWGRQEGPGRLPELSLPRAALHLSSPGPCKPGTHPAWPFSPELGALFVGCQPPLLPTVTSSGATAGRPLPGCGWPVPILP